MRNRLWKQFAAALTVLTCLSLPGYAGAYTFSQLPTYTRVTTVKPPTTFASRTTGSAGSTSAASVEATLLSHLNQERTSRGLRALQLDPAAAGAARAKSQDMVSKNYFSHTSPTYGSPAQLLSRFGVRYNSWAENIGRADGAARLHALWMASAGHRANILNPALTHVGIGVVSGSGGFTATELFIAR